MTAAIEICNMAIGHIGVTIPIADFEEGSVPAQVCRMWYSQARDRLLQSYDWTFARKRVALVASSVNDRSDLWQYRYPITHPDLLEVRFVDNESFRPGVRDPAIFEIEGDVAYSNVPNAWLHYTKRVEDTEVFKPHFVEALAWALAARVAFPITKDHQIRKDAVEMAIRELVDAQVSDSNQEEEMLQLPSLIRVRGE